MNDEKISIIVPIYNVEKYLGQCLQSIINQTYKNLEIILVDDGSTDSSSSVCSEYAEKDDRIRVYHKENGGLSDARNYGIERATGYYIGFVDGDDFIHPQMYEILYEILCEYNTGAAACKFERNSELFNEVRINRNNLAVSIYSAQEAIADPCKTLVPAWNKLYKKSVFKDIRFPVGRLHEDEFVYHQLMWNCKDIAVIEDSLYCYIIRNDSIMESMNEKRITDALDAFDQRIQFVEAKRMTDILEDVIDRYCCYCVDTYYAIKSADTRNEHREWLHKLYDAECKMASRKKVKKKYGLFIEDPDVYEKKYRNVRMNPIVKVFTVFKKIIKTGENY